MLNGLDLFSGVGGFSFSLAPWVRPVAYCENDRYAQAVLVSRMRAGDISTAPIWDDVRTLGAHELGLLCSNIDIVYGGFPCQDISVAGAGRGLAGERSGLVKEIFRLVDELRPSFVFLENVPAIRTRGADVVIGEMARLRYDARWVPISAFEIGAPHLRVRWFMVAADSKRLGIRIEQGRIRWESGDGQAVARDDGAKESVADALGVRERELSTRQRDQGEGATNFNWRRKTISSTDRSSWWATEPDVGRVAYGVPSRVDRIRGLGNAVVPFQAREAFERLIGFNSINKET